MGTRKNRLVPVNTGGVGFVGQPMPVNRQFRGRGLKRLPDVPPAVDALGTLVSKATLLEVAYWFAIRLSGEEDETQALNELVNEIETLTRKKVKVPSKMISARADALRRALAGRGAS